jgi:hypothetical protein
VEQVGSSCNVPTRDVTLGFYSGETEVCWHGSDSVCCIDHGGIVFPLLEHYTLWSMIGVHWQDGGDVSFYKLTG